ncbi:MAG: 5'/3'-nucleotidase SurE, partial [Hyphomicrobium sp.]
RIMVTNDDGIGAHGLDILRQIALQLSSDVWVIAPEVNQSGASHSLTLHEPLRFRQVDDRTFVIRGTPTDCVIMGVRHLLLEKRPDLILSGVNQGSNLGEDVTYSGTIAAAIEGTLLGIRSIALSQTGGSMETEGKIHWQTPLAHGRALISKLLATGWPTGIVINVNFPACSPEDVAGIEVTTQGRRDQALLHIDKRSDPWGTPYFWFGFERPPTTFAKGTDLAAVDNGAISVTPLCLNLTDRETCAKLEDAFAPAAPKWSATHG